jgi:signal transduction histidine kinase
MEEWERLLDELSSELSLRERELAFLHAIDLRLLESQNSPQETFDFVVAGTRELLQAHHTTILLRRSTFLEPMYSTLESVVGQRVPISKSLTGLSLETAMPVNVSDLMTSELSARYAPLRGYNGPPMRSLLAAPIKIDDAIVGVLNVESTEPDVFKRVHERMAVAVASQVAIALQRTQTLASSVLFADVDRLMFVGNDPEQRAKQSEDVIQVALEKVMSELRRYEHIHYAAAQIMFLQNQEQLEIVYSTNPSDIGRTLPVANSVSGRAVRERRSIIVGDASDDPEYQILGNSTNSEIAVPILFGEDDLVIGVLNVESTELDAFSEFYRVVLESFAEKVRTLLAFTRLRAHVTEAVELRTADELLLAIDDQATQVIHRVNNTVGAMRFRLKELQARQDDGSLDDIFLRESLSSLLGLAERALRIPDEIMLKGDQAETIADINDCVVKAIEKLGTPDGVVLELQLAEQIPRQQLYCFDLVIRNLLQNALDAMPNGGRLSVTTSLVLDPAYSTSFIQLSIRDTGIGIPADVQPLVFKQNFTTKHAKGKGLGFGLWWVRTFVRRARGDIIIRSDADAGTEVVVKIPVIDRST